MIVFVLFLSRIVSYSKSVWAVGDTTLQTLLLELLPSEFILLSFCELALFGVELGACLFYLCESPAKLGVLEDIDAARKCKSVAMFEDATRLLRGKWSTVDKGAHCGICNDYKLEQAILQHFNFSMVLFDPCSTDDNVWLRRTCFAAD